MMHEVNVDAADSGLTIEYFPASVYPQKILMLLDFERIPTHKKYAHAAFASDNTTTTTWNSNGGKQLLNINSLEPVFFSTQVSSKLHAGNTEQILLEFIIPNFIRKLAQVRVWKEKYV